MDLRLARDGKILCAATTNADGRTDQPMLEGDDFTPGTYEFTFDVAVWRQPDAPGFYDSITIRFVVPPDPGHIHIPLLLSPFGYTTYRGS